MKTISKITALICLLSAFILTGCKDDEELRDTFHHLEYLKVHIQDKDGNNLLDATNPNNVIYNVQADLWTEEGVVHLNEAYNYRPDLVDAEEIEDLINLPAIKMAKDDNSETTYHYQFCHVGVWNNIYESESHSFKLVLYIPDEAPRRFDILYESFAHDNPLQKKYGNCRWTVNGEVLPDNDLTVIL